MNDAEYWKCTLKYSLFQHNLKLNSTFNFKFVKGFTSEARVVYIIFQKGQDYDLMID